MAREKDDWRLTNQEGYLREATLTWKRYHAPHETWDHDHCEFCWAKFMDTSRFDDESREQHADILSAGYTPAPPNPRFGSAWICPTCFEDFRERFSWTVVSDDSEASG